MTNLIPKASHLTQSEHLAANARDILPFNLEGAALTKAA